MTNLALFFDSITSCDNSTGAFTFKFPLSTIEKLKKLCRVELGKGNDGKDLPPKRLILAEQIAEAQAEVTYYQELLGGSERWGLNDLAWFEHRLQESKANLSKLLARQNRARKQTNNQKFDVEAIKANNDLLDVAKSYGLDLKKRGREYWAKCPFHNDRTPSFSINQRKQFYFCFGCGKSGDVIGFIQEIEGVNFVEALERLGG